MSSFWTKAWKRLEVEVVGGRTVVSVLYGCMTLVSSTMAQAMLSSLTQSAISRAAPGLASARSL
eukprot:7869842-Heterocapsa_arctica.AAC.1